jgi:Na+/glutamate symporter
LDESIATSGGFTNARARVGLNQVPIITGLTRLLEAIATFGILTGICAGVSVIKVLIVTLFTPVGVHEAIATGRELT